MEEKNNFLEKAVSLKVSEKVQFAAFFSLAIFVPLLGLNQFITGSIVNAILILSCLLIGFSEAALIGSFTALSALSKGVLFGSLTFALTPMIPFIALGNFILVFLVSLMKNKNYWLATFIGAVSKTVFLSICALILSKSIKLPQLIVLAMTYPQMVTSILGGIIAFSILKFYKKDLQ